MCSDNRGACGVVDGECPSCGAPTVEGVSIEICNYSTVECEECENAPCDGAC